LEQLYNTLKIGYLGCGVPYVYSVHLVKIRSNRLLQIKPAHNFSDLLFTNYSVLYRSQLTEPELMT